MFSKEWDRLTTSVREKQEQLKGREESSRRVKQRIKQTAVEFTKRSSLLPLALIATIFFFQQLSGTYPIIFYAVQVFQSIGGDFGAGLNADSATILLGIIRFATSLLTAGLSRKFGRRPLLMVSGIGMAVSGLAAAVYFQGSCVFNSVFNSNQAPVNTTVPPLNSTQLCGDELDDFSKLIGLVSILLFVFMSSIGFLIIPWTLVGEILPASIRGTGGGLMISYAYFLMFGVVKVFPFLLDVFHISGLFYFFSLTSLVNVVIVYLFLPETLGKSFDEIEKFFAGEKKR